MDWEGEGAGETDLLGSVSATPTSGAGEENEETSAAAETRTLRRAITIDVSDKVHLEATLARPPRPLRPNESGGASSSSSSTSSTSQASRNAKVGIVVTHPHPLLGGNMHNNVVTALFKRFAAEGFCVVRFNFRGTGQSTGSRTWRGSGEREDVVAVCRYLQSECGVEAVYVVGYSYGSAIACSVVNDVDIIKGCIAVSYPFGVLTWILLGHLLNMAKTQKPSLWVIGTDDNFTSVARFRTSVKALALLGLAEEEDVEKTKKKKNADRNKTYNVEYFKSRLQTTAIVQEMDHFWFDDEDILCDICVAWIQARLGDEEREADTETEESHPGKPRHQQQQQHKLNDDTSEENHSKL